MDGEKRNDNTHTCISVCLSSVLSCLTSLQPTTFEATKKPSRQTKNGFFYSKGKHKQQKNVYMKRKRYSVGMCRGINEIPTERFERTVSTE